MCPGRFVSWTFCNWTLGNWTFSFLDVYVGRSVTGRLGTGPFVAGIYVTGRFVGVQYVLSPYFFHATFRLMYEEYHKICTGTVHTRTLCYATQITPDEPGQQSRALVPSLWE